MNDLKKCVPKRDLESKCKESLRGRKEIKETESRGVNKCV
uniref:Uncharacterized protein n=1 Tax=Tetranychus urticae TaxID=32264 RepID=T1KKF5_TETUR